MTKIISLSYLTTSSASKEIIFTKNRNDEFSSTIITGENGAGKSSILKRIIEHYFDRDREKIEQRSDLSSVEDSFLIKKGDVPSVLAISGTSSDRFPIRGSIFKENYDDCNYIYLGQKVNANLLSKRKSLETICSHLFQDSSKYRLDLSIMGDLCTHIGIQQELEITFRMELRVDDSKHKSFHLRELWEKLERITEKNDRDLIRKLGLSKGTAKFISDTVDYEYFSEFEAFLASNSDRSTRRLRVVVNKELFSKELSPDAVRLGVLLGVFKIDDVLVRRASTDKQISIFELSSGEYHFFTSIFGVIICADSDSLILVDEPENSLHPKWQVDFMNMMYKACELVENGQLIVSTHSPLIVSAAKPETTLIDLSDDAEIVAPAPENGYGSSVDSILLDHFGLVSSRNLYFIDLLQNVVDMFSNGETNSKEFVLGVEHLQSIKSNLKENDPLIELIDVLSANNDRNYV